MKDGTLVCVGSGIKSVGQFTLEAQGWIAQADLVVYCVTDPVTEIWIKQKSRAHLDLYTLYGNDKGRMQTYEEMVEVMVANVRAGKTVCAVFYGHPGVFVLPTHRAIATLRAEGFKALMLPGISAVDCLFADIGVDPATKGCQMVEATDLLLRRRPLLTDGHVVIWQIGCVGDPSFRFAGFDNRNLGVLVDYLLEFYQPIQEVIHYIASQFPVSLPRIERIPLERLLDAQIIGISTLYIPPARERETVSEMALKMGWGLASHPAVPESLPVAENEGSAGRPQYLRDVPLKSYRPSKQCSGLADYIADLAQNPQMLAEFNRNPEVASRIHASMTAEEYHALISRRPGRIHIALKSPKHPHLAELEKPLDSNGNTTS